LGNKIDYNNWTKNQLLSLKHNDYREKVYLDYIKQKPVIFSKREFLVSWIKPKKEDFILECGSSSGITGIHLTKNSGCYVLGIDFDSKAIKISARMRNKFFPELKSKCCFRTGNLETMRFPTNVTKVVMADFTEHIPDKVFSRILNNIKKQLGHVTLYIHTPPRDNIFEIMRRKNFILKRHEGHINTKTSAELKSFIESRGWKVIESGWRYHYNPYVRIVEQLFCHLPFLKKFFQRKITLIAIPNETTIH
jgi:cyclopropane fatty-acyl-phospholipid synthase-like methyltransferase